MRRHSWLRHCANPERVTGIVYWQWPAQPLKEMSTRCVGLTTLAPSSVDCTEIWETQPPDTLKALTEYVQGLLYLYLYVIRIK
jgi:hypothetical protein